MDTSNNGLRKPKVGKKKKVNESERGTKIINYFGS